jgi:hypothetical protein
MSEGGAIDAVTSIILNEGAWLTIAMTVAASGVAWLLRRYRRTGAAVRSLAAAAMSLAFALTIGTMAFGHLLAVTAKLALGTLDGSPLVVYGIGLALAGPSWWLIRHASRLVTDVGATPRALMLNVWVSVTLVALGPHNLPLAAPGLCNVAYLWSSRPVVGQVMVVAFVVLNAGLFIGSLIFLASGQTFEQFRGIP